MTGDDARGPDLSVRLGPLRLANPVIAASSEVTMTEEGIGACIDAGAGAVVAKSVNELPEAAEQLDIADYALVAADRTLTPWAEARPDDSLLCRSGLAQVALDDWLAMLERCERKARDAGSMVIGSITVAGAEPAARIAARIAEVVGAVELNLSAPHGREAARGAVRQLTDADLIGEYTAAVRRAVDCPLIVKLTAQTGDVVALARAARDAGADVVAMIGRFGGFLPDVETAEPVLGSWAAVGGGWALPVALYWVSKSRRALPDGFPIIGTNGARDGLDVVRFLLAGACAVEMASLLMTHGPGVIEGVLGDVERYAADHGVDAIESIIGTAAHKARTYAEIPPVVPPSRPWEPLLSREGED